MLVLPVYSVTPPTGGVSYYDFSSIEDIWELHNGTNTNAVAIPNYPTFNISGDSSSDSFSFNGANAQIDLTNSLDYQFTKTQNFTISMWVNTTQTGGWIRIFHRGNGASPYQGLHFGKRATDDALYIELYCDAGNIGRLTNKKINLGRWLHIAVTKDATATSAGFNLYINGTDVDTGNSQGGDNCASGDGSFDASAFFGHSNLGDWYNGNIDEAKIFNRTLTPTEIQNLYNYGDEAGVSPPVGSPFANNLSLRDNALNEIPLNQINESVEFFIFNNYTINNVTDGTATCNISMDTIMAHLVLSNTSNHTLSTSTDQITLLATEENNTFIRDVLEFEVCRGSGKTPLQIYFNGTQLKEIDQDIIPLCSSGGFHQEFSEFTQTNYTDSFNLTLQCSGCGAGKSLTILTDEENDLLHFNRERAFMQMDLTYNATSEFYEQREHLHEYGTSSTKWINVTCNGTTTNYSFTVGDQNLTVLIDNIDGVAYSDGMNVESSNSTNISLEIRGDIVASIDFNVTNVSGGLIKNVNTEIMTLNQIELGSDGTYNISVLATDDDGNSTFITGFFIINDTTNPSITWTNPLNDNTTTMTANFSNQISMSFSDINLFAYNVIVRNPSGGTEYQFNLTDINTTSASLVESITPNLLGTWEVFAEVSDDHTTRSISDWEHYVENQDINFNFSTMLGRLERDDLNVKIRYQGTQVLQDIEVIKKKDRYKFRYNIFKDVRDTEQIHKFRVRCKGLTYRPFSDFDGHMICWDTKTWLDFETESLRSYRIRDCGVDCFDVIVVTDVVDVLEFNSIGGLNIINETVEFDVLPLAETNTSLAINECPSTTQGMIGLFIIVGLLCFFLVIALMLNNVAIGMVVSGGFLAMSWVIVGCWSIIGWVIALIAMVLLIMFGLMEF